MPPPTRRRRHHAAVVSVVITTLLLLSLAATPRPASAQQAAGASSTSSSSTSTEALPASSSSLAASAAAAAAAGVPLAKPDYTVYKTRERVFDEIERLVAANPRTMRLDVIEAPPAPPPPPNKGGGDYKNGNKKKPSSSSSSSSSYSPPLRVVTVEPGGLSPGPPGSAAERESYADKYRLLLNYGEHGRELVTVESALVLLRDLSAASEESERSSGGGLLGARAAAAADADPLRSSLGGSERLRSLLKQAVFKIVPMENEAGRELVERGQLCERKNGRGVDPNRNWGVDWGKKESDYDPSEEFPGDSPFSEPEARGLAGLAAAFAPHAWINVHSGMEAVFSPYDHVAATPKGASADATAALLAAVDAAACGGRCAKGSGGAAVGYLAHGTATDYMYDVLKVPVASTWEIYGDEEAGFEDCFRMFNPTVATEADVEAAAAAAEVSVSSAAARKKKKPKTMPSLEKVAAAWADGALVVLENLPSHPGVKLGPEARDAQANAARAVAAQFDGRLAARGGGGGGWEEVDEGLPGGAGAKAAAATTNISRSTKASSRSLPRPMGGHAVSSSSSSSSSNSNSNSIHWLSAGVVAVAAGAFVVGRRRKQQQQQFGRRREGGPASAAAAAAASSGVIGVSSVGGVISVGGERGALGLLSKPQRQE